MRKRRVLHVTRETLVLLTALSLSAPLGAPLGAQLAPDEQPWRFVQVGMASAASTFFEGPRIATVSSSAGAGLGIGLQRRVRPRLETGVILRVLVSPIKATEAGASWSLGSMREVGAVGTASVDGYTGQRLALKVEGAAGISVMSGVDGALPFSDLAVISPSIEAGVALGQPPKTGRREWWLTARANTLRMGRASANAGFTEGWGRRLLIGVRTVR
jgi:hypothetical protein